MTGRFIPKVLKYSDFEFIHSYLLNHRKIIIIDEKADHILDPKMNAYNVNDYISSTKGRETTNLIDILKCHHIL